jgi:hypothetical protein
MECFLSLFSLQVEVLVVVPAERAAQPRHAASQSPRAHGQGGGGGVAAAHGGARQDGTDGVGTGIGIGIGIGPCLPVPLGVRPFALQ